MNYINQNYIEVKVFPSTLNFIKEENYTIEFTHINVDTNEETLVDVVTTIGTLDDIRKEYLHKVEEDGTTYALDFNNVKG